VGGQSGEGLSAFITVSDTRRVAEPATLMLLVTGVGALPLARRMRPRRKRARGGRQRP
jgi:hypothetical protein